ncbi:HTH-type transcriptional activator RhaS [bioreactor metagenome]|uniref:HTH-type transcriptional activator RhaS n=1 Tax=bioreactor metagenome TaxID=1076179 RepID=A0A645C630_9ZZZZ
MKNRLTTEEDYRRRVNLVIEYVRKNLDSEIDINILAELSAFSPFHLHRILRGYLGEPIGAFIVRTRVEAAATLLRYSDMAISDIAYRVGYGTPSSLTKAFVKQMKISPTEYRTTKNYRIMTTQSPRPAVNLTKGKTVELKELENYPIICLEQNTSARKYIDMFFEKNGAVLNPEFELATSDLIVQFAKRGLGVGCVVRNFAEKQLEEGRLFELNLKIPIPPREICIVTNKKTPISPAGKKLLSILSA